MLATLDTDEEVMRMATVFLQYYRENADYKERMYDFVPRVGLDEVKAVVTDADAAPSSCWSGSGSPRRPRPRRPMAGARRAVPPAPVP